MKRGNKVSEQRQKNLMQFIKINSEIIKNKSNVPPKEMFEVS